MIYRYFWCWLKNKYELKARVVYKLSRNYYQYEIDFLRFYNNFECFHEIEQRVVIEVHCKKGEKTVFLPDEKII